MTASAMSPIGVCPTWLLPWLDVTPGTEWDTLARFVGWCFAGGYDGPAALARSLQLNREWGNPLTAADVSLVVGRVAATDAPRAFKRRRRSP